MELDESSLSAIRSILTEDPEPAPRSRFSRSKAAPEEPVAAPALVPRKADGLPDLAQAEINHEPQEVAKKPKRGFSLRRKSAAPEKAAPMVATAKPKRVEEVYSAVDAGLLDRIRAYRPPHITHGYGCLCLAGGSAAVACVRVDGLFHNRHDRGFPDRRV